jgi:hypothetical protein
VSVQWLSWVHSTQRCVFVKHAGVAGVSWQSLFRPHSTQVCVLVKQNGVWPLQSPFAAHPTHTLLLQMGVGVLQSEFWLHPAMQLPLSQTGVGALQSASRVHWSVHVWLFVSQIGVGAAQSPLTTHSTQACVVASHAGVLPAQSAFERQAPGGRLQAFVAMSHLPFVPQSKSEKHSTQTPTPEQYGLPVPAQSLATSHSTHCPAALQIGLAESVQFAAVRHSTHTRGAFVAQKGVGAEHPVFAVHAVVHCRAETLHVFPVPQSESCTHATHRASVTSQTGVGAAHAPPQSGGGRAPPVFGNGDPPADVPPLPGLVWPPAPPRLTPPVFAPEVPVLPPLGCNPPLPCVLASAPPCAPVAVAAFPRLVSVSSPQAAASAKQRGTESARKGVRRVMDAPLQS